VIGVLDIIATLLFAAAAGIALYALVAVRNRVVTTPVVYGMLAAAVMAVVSFGNALNNLGISSAMHESEEYVELLFVPAALYMMFGLYTWTQTSQVSREHEIVHRLDDRLADSLHQLDGHRLGVLQALCAAVDARDHYTALHSLHVADYAAAIGYRLGMKDELLLFEQAGLLHDVGKIGVPDTLLLKPTSLTGPEYATMKQHVEESARILAALPFLTSVVPMVRHHHERWDGSGYPDGLAGEDIPRPARVLAVADAFDAMTTDRPYRPAMPVATAREFLVEGKGSQFDPSVVDAFITLLDLGLVAVEDRAAAS
jgi:putative nucleotidyltransferase with HDIG domain